MLATAVISGDRINEYFEALQQAEAAKNCFVNP
jgi:hypothetical protein